MKYRNGGAEEFEDKDIINVQENSEGAALLRERSYSYVICGYVIWALILWFSFAMGCWVFPLWVLRFQGFVIGICLVYFFHFAFYEVDLRCAVVLAFCIGNYLLGLKASLALSLREEILNHDFFLDGSRTQHDEEENMLAESRLMIPDCHKRLEDALGDLKGTLVELEESGHKDGLEAMMLEAS
ncbi:UNVERIFIED_CONTAM: Tubulin-folding cofactor A [Sesamum calycinum]|uniref:Tubulin-folding cofactor A n=1 Tax=Sesamum calycinum TaxID=2727403 RepID=A0AAW2T193_9LAMI